MQIKKIYIAFVAFTLTLCTACVGDKNTVPVSNEIILTGIDDTHWTYFSFEKGEVVGRSVFASDEEDAQWAARNDWDIAFCGEFMRTNSGTSGGGNGGIQRNTITNYYSLTEAPIDGYLTDTNEIIVKR